MQWGAIVRSMDFQWLIGVTRKIISPCTLEMMFITLKEALVKVWGYSLVTVEIDLRKELIIELQAGPLAC